MVSQLSGLLFKNNCHTANGFRAWPISWAKHSCLKYTELFLVHLMGYFVLNYQ